MSNTVKTTFLLALLSCLILWLGAFLGGQAGMVFALVIALVMNMGAYWFSDKIALASYRAKEVDRSEAPGLYRMVEGLAQKAEIPTPRIFIIPSESPNAFATGRNPEHAVVAVTHGILRLMKDEELEGVLAHELSHVKNRDILTMSVAATLGAAVMFVATMARWSAIFGGFGGGDRDERGGLIGLLLISILGPIAALIIQMAISRTREYQADASGAKIAGNPEGLARALEKLGVATKRIPMKAQPTTAHMFIVNPLSGAGLASLFSTHPPLEERIRRLRGRS